MSHRRGTSQHEDVTTGRLAQDGDVQKRDVRAGSIKSTGSQRNSVRISNPNKAASEFSIVSRLQEPSTHTFNLLRELHGVSPSENWNFMFSTRSSSQVRPHWKHSYDFIFASVGMVVGLGNVHRFPATAYKNGSAAFLVPYTLFHILIGLPFFLMEVTLGQYSGRGPIRVWAFNNAAMGVGIVIVISIAINSILYNCTIAQVLFYLFASMQSPLPWTQCEASWVERYRCFNQNSVYSFPACDKVSSNTSYSTSSDCKCTGKIIVDFNISHPCFDASQSYENLTKETTLGYCKSMLRCRNDTTSPSLLYYRKMIQQNTDNITYSALHIGNPSWYLSYCLLLSWIIVVIMLMNGIYTASKVVYFTAICPYVILSCMFIATMTEPGGFDGIKSYVLPKWEKLQDTKVWSEALLQMMHSLGFASGGNILLSSFNRYSHNIYRDTILIVMIDYLTCIFAGLVVFTSLGILKHQHGLNEKVFESVSSDLTFVVLTHSISYMEWPVLWSVLFFFMVYTMAVDSMIFMIEIVLTSIKDELPYLRKRSFSVAVLYGILGFLLGLPLLTPGSRYIMKIFVEFSQGHVQPVVLSCYMIFVAWGYGPVRIMENLSSMLGFHPWPRYFWLVTWFTLPIFITTQSVMELSNITFKHGDGSDMDFSSKIVALLILGLIILPIPAWFIYTVYHTEGNSMLHRITKAHEPSPDWVPQKTSEMFDKTGTQQVETMPCDSQISTF